MKTLMIFDLADAPPADHNYDEDLRSDTDEWEAEATLLSAMRALGHDVKLFGVHDDVRGLFDVIREHKPDLVLNLCEAFSGNRDYEPHLAALLELMNVRYTGARPAALRLCKDKALSKKILAFHGIDTPGFEVSRRAQPLAKLKTIRYPALVKPLGLEASAGIAQCSLVNDEEAALARIKYVHEKLEQDAIVEEYIEGRELYVAVMGNERYEVFPPRELFFDRMPDDVPRFATFKAKWDEEYRAKWGIRTDQAAPLPDGVEKRLVEDCKTICRALTITGYARIDLRLTSDGKIVFLEANPNPSIAKSDDFAQAAIASGLSYEKLIAKLIRLSGV